MRKTYQTLNEELNRIKVLMGIINEEENPEKKDNIEKKEEKSSFSNKTNYAPHGVIFDGSSKVMVGDDHETAHELSDDLVDKIIEIGDSYGYWGEGIGIDYNNAVLNGPVYAKSEKLNTRDKYMGAWDDEVKVPKESKWVFLYALFSNIEQNHRVEKLSAEVKEGETIFDLLNRTKNSWSAEGGRYGLGSEDLKKFLIESSQPDMSIDFLKMSQLPATERNIEAFLTLGDKLQWPSNWKDYPYKAGQVARRATNIRDEYLISAGPGVYFVGSGHLKDIVDMESGKKKGLKLIGGGSI